MQIRLNFPVKLSGREGTFSTRNYHRPRRGTEGRRWRNNLYFLAVGLIWALTGLSGFFFLPWASAQEETITPGETLDLQRCIRMALTRHPAVLSAAGAVKVNESRVGQARANYFPQIGVSSSYSRVDPYYTPAGTVAQQAGNVYNQYGNSVSLNQTIYDFGKTAAQVDVQIYNTDSSRQDFHDARRQIVYGVKQAYYSYLKAKRNRDVAADTVRQFEHHLVQSRGFFEVGTKPKFDVTKAEVDLSNARLNMIKAENDFRIARVNLNNALGYPDAPEYEARDVEFTVYRPDIDFVAALKRAYEERPDLKAAVSKREAAEKAVTAAKKGYYPNLTGTAGYGWGGQEFPWDKGWNVGATLNIPIFSGLSTKYQVDEARANLEVAKANEKTIRQNIFLELKQAYSNFQEVSERVATAAIQVKQAAENLELAEGRYASGVGNAIEVTDALVSLNNARTSHAAAVYDYMIAQAGIEKATGVQ
jgi:outer membrane protein TolC